MNENENVDLCEYRDNVQDQMLPKWPALVVTGNRLTEEQAAQVVIQTDTFFPDFSLAGNDDAFAHELNGLFGIPDASYRFNRPQDERFETIKQHHITIDKMRQYMNIMELEYLTNSQIFSAYIGGPHGWCDWNGNVFCNTFNIGKWPEVTDVGQEWGQIAQQFPFLELRAQLFSGEACEIEREPEPVVEYHVSNGKVVAYQPQEPLTPLMDTTHNDVLNIVFGNPSRERGIHAEQLREKVELIYGHVPQFDQFYQQKTNDK